MGWMDGGEWDTEGNICMYVVSGQALRIRGLAFVFDPIFAPLTTHTMLAFITSRLKFIDNCRKNNCLMDKETAVVDLIAVKIADGKQRNFKMAESIEIADAVNSSSLSEENKMRLSQIIAGHTNIGLPPVNRDDLQDSDQAKYQVNDFVENYFTEGEWLWAAANVSSSTTNELAGMISKAIFRSGWYHISQIDFAKVVGTFGGLNGFDAQGKEGLAVVQRLKKNHKSMKAGLTDTDLHMLVQIFPEEPLELPEPWLSQSQCNGLLTKCKRLQETVDHWKRVTPARKSHWSVKDNVNTHSCALTVANQSAMAKPDPARHDRSPPANMQQHIPMTLNCMDQASNVMPMTHQNMFGMFQQFCTVMQNQGFLIK